MNIFRLLGAPQSFILLLHLSPYQRTQNTGDLSHLASILVLLHKIQTSRSCRGQPRQPLHSQRIAVLTCPTGISFKTQALYVVVFVARYLDLVFRWVSVYNFCMKVFFIASSCYVLYLMKYKFRYVPYLFLGSSHTSTASHVSNPPKTHT
jgi:hypothetical protein